MPWPFLVYFLVGSILTPYVHSLSIIYISYLVVALAFNFEEYELLASSFNNKDKTSNCFGGGLQSGEHATIVKILSIP